MSTKKILRLKTPLKLRQQQERLDSSVKRHSQFNQQSTISLVKNVACSEQLQITLINEINKIYKQLSKQKKEINQVNQINDEMLKENQELKRLIQLVQNDYKMIKEKYKLQKQNHESLRKFYEQRQKEWVEIVNHHKRILQEYRQYNEQDSQNMKTLSQWHTNSSIQSIKYTSLQQVNVKAQNNTRVSIQQSKIKTSSSISRKERRPMRKSSIESHNQNVSKSKEKIYISKTFKNEENILNSINKLYSMESKFAEESQNQYKNLHKSYRSGNVIKNAEEDDFFELIVRKTYYAYREKNILVADIQSMEDMLKLKNAKTSTKERLCKTIRKLDFQVRNDNELKLLSDYVEKAVHEKYKILRGDYAYELLIDKLKECQKLANTSNSELDRLYKDQSKYLSDMSSSLTQSNKLLAKNNYCSLSNLFQRPSRIQPSNLGKHNANNLQLLLCSNINKSGIEESVIKMKPSEIKSQTDGLYLQSRVKDKNNYKDCKLDRYF